MKIHELKSWPSQFMAVRGGDKVHEVRVDDRRFVVGDALHLREWCPKNRSYTGCELLVKVTHITRGGTFELPNNVVCMSIRVLAWELK